MNDPTKRIDVEKSSLLSLKAELLRKQEEVLKNKKAVPAFVKQSSSKVKDPTATELKVKGGKVVEYEDLALMAKSKRILEAKAKFYDKMMKSKGEVNSDDFSLVMFNKKSQNNRQDSEDDDSEMVDFTDCFGRSRRIPRKDLSKIKEQDNELSDVVDTRGEQADPNRDVSKSPQSTGELSDADSEPMDWTRHWLTVFEKTARRVGKARRPQQGTCRSSLS